MKNWNKYAFIRLLIFLISGIIVAKQNDYFSLNLIYLLLFFIVIYLLLSFFISKYKRFNLRTYKGFVAFVIVFLFAWTHTHNFTGCNSIRHFIHQKDTIQAYIATTNSNIKETAKTYKVELWVQHIKVNNQWQKNKGKVLAYFKKSEGQKNNLKYGDTVLIKGSPQLLQKPLNPKAFDYREYLYFQNIYHQHFIPNTYYKVLSNNQNFSFRRWVSNLRQDLDKGLQSILIDPESYAVASALILGLKDHLDYELKDAYAGAGMMHILAVSGLHVGIVMLILQFILKRLSKKSKFWEWLVTLIIILILFLYAFLTGLSASVLRATTMFSIILLSKQLGQNSNIYNTLALSAFILLCFNPFLLYSVSFQLSYVAVIGIVYLQPKINAWFWHPNKIIASAWDLLSVSIAAQIATFPLGLYYFHQFPNLFFISNLIILPAIPFVLGLGLLSLLLANMPIVGLILGAILSKVLLAMNLVILFVNSLPLSVSTGISISFLEMLLIYGSIIFFLILFAQKKFFYLIVSLCLLISFVSLRIYQVTWQHKQSHLSIYHIPKASIFQIIEGQKAYFLTDTVMDSKNQEFQFNIQQNYDYLGIQKYQDFLFAKDYKNQAFAYKTFEKYAFLVWNRQKILILHQNFYKQDYEEIANLKVDYIIMRNNAIYSLKHLPQKYHKTPIILDASNSYYRQQKLLKEAQKLQINLHLTAKKGAFIIDKL